MSKLLSIDTAVNWQVSAEYQNKERYAVNTNNSSNYIKMSSYQDTYNGKSYYATDYEVYQNNKLVLKTTDNRTGIEHPIQNWVNVRSELKNAMNDCKVYLVTPEVFHKLQEKDELSKTVIREQAAELKKSGIIQDEEVYVNEIFAVQIQEQQSVSDLVLKEVLDNYEKQLMDHSKSIPDSQTLSDQRSGQKVIEQKQTLNEKKEKIVHVKAKAEHTHSKTKASHSKEVRSNERGRS